MIPRTCEKDILPNAFGHIACVESLGRAERRCGSFASEHVTGARTVISLTCDPRRRTDRTWLTRGPQRHVMARPKLPCTLRSENAQQLARGRALHSGNCFEKSNGLKFPPLSGHTVI